MRFYSQKTSRERNTTLFTALSNVARCFVSRLTSFSGLCGNSVSLLRHRPRYILLSIVVVLCVVLSGTNLLLAARNVKSFVPEHKTINVFPSRVESSAWKNIETLGSQDVDEQCLFQSFNGDNSAYIDLKQSVRSTESIETSQGSASTPEPPEPQPAPSDAPASGSPELPTSIDIQAPSDATSSDVTSVDSDQDAEPVPENTAPFEAVEPDVVEPASESISEPTPVPQDIPQEETP